MKKSKGFRSGARRLLTKEPRERGKMKLSKLLYEYQPGTQVVIKIDSAVHKGMPHKRYPPSKEHACKPRHDRPRKANTAA